MVHLILFVKRRLIVNYLTRGFIFTSPFFFMLIWSGMVNVLYNNDNGNMYNIPIINSNDEVDDATMAIFKYSYSGMLFWEIQTRGYSLMVDEDNNFYVSNDKIIDKYDENGNYLFTISIDNECTGYSLDLLSVTNKGLLTRCKYNEGEEYRPMFIAYDVNGKKSWTRQYGTIENYTKIMTTMNGKGEYIILQGEQGIISKIDKYGNEIWKNDQIKNENMNSFDYLECDGNDNIIFVGSQYNEYESVDHIIKINDTGQEQWRIIIPIIETPKSGYMPEDDGISFGTNGRMFLLDGLGITRIEKNGEYMRFAYEEMPNLPTIRMDGEGNLILLSGNGIGYYGIVIIRKINENGEQQWQRTYQPKDWIGNGSQILYFLGADVGKDSIISLNLIISNQKGLNKDTNPIYFDLMLIDKEGNLLWEKSQTHVISETYKDENKRIYDQGNAIFTSTTGDIYMTNKAKPQPYDEDDDDAIQDDDDNDTSQDDDDANNQEEDDETNDETACGC